MDAPEPIRFENGSPMLLAGIRRRHEFSAADRGIPEQWRQFRAFGQLPGRIGDYFYGAVCGHDSAGFEYLSGIEVASFNDLPAGIGRMRVPAQRYAVFLHDGDAAGLRIAWQHIIAWLPHSGYDSAHTPDFERYGPRFDAASGRGEVEIWIGVVPRAEPRAPQQ